MASGYERNLARQFLAFLSMTLRWPAFLFFATFRVFRINFLFTVYPGSVKDMEGYALPGLRKVLAKYTSGKPFIAGIITSGHGYGRGLVLAVPNTIDQIRGDKRLVWRIMKRLDIARKMTGAKTVSIAGQGPKFFKSHYPDYQEPFIYGLKGRVFSVVETIERIFENHGLSKDRTLIALLGIGEIGEAILRNLRDLGYSAKGIGIQTLNGQVTLSGDGYEVLKAADMIVVQTPRGNDAVRFYPDMKQTAILVDDSHPRITVVPDKFKFYKVAIGRPGVTFKPPLPGYKDYWIPGCVQESMVVAETGRSDLSQDEFNRKSKELGFYAHLEEVN